MACRQPLTQMKKLLLALAACCLLAAAAPAQDATATMKRDAEKCGKALLAEDYPQVIAFTHKRVVAAIGGADALIAMLKSGRKAIRDTGHDFLEARIGTPETPRKIGEWLVALVPQEIVMKAPGGRLRAESSLLALSEDEGRSWAFLDIGSIDPAQFAKLFPELAGKVSLPGRKQPVFEKS